MSEAESVSPEKSAAHPDTASAETANAETVRGKLLVVDDSRTHRNAMARHLQRQGHQVTIAESGPLALALMRGEPFDLVLLDVLMPEMDGYQVLEQMKRDRALRDIPVIMVSALEELASVVRCIEMGAEDYLPKVFEPVLLRARINASLEKKRLRDQEVEYLRQVKQLTAAAAAVESATFALATLDGVASRLDELGQLARVFQRMAQEVQAREQRLQRQLRQLRIEVDEVNKARQVSEITESDYFQELRSRAKELRARVEGEDREGGRLE